MAGQAFVAVLHFLQEDNIRINGVERHPYIMDARPPTNAGDPLVDIVGGNSELND